MNLDFVVPAITTLLLFLILLGTMLIAHSITENANIQKLAIENRCEFNAQTSVWENCKGPVTQESK